MANPSKRKGTQFEVDVRDYLRDKGFRADRLALAGSKDCGDITGVPGWVLELKATKKHDLAQAMREAEDEAANAGADYFCAVMKRPRAPIRDAYVVIPLWEWVELYFAIHGKPS